jgi:hypothetical protein
MLQVRIKGYMRELDMWSSVGDSSGIHVVSISSATTCVQLSHAQQGGIIRRSIERDRCTNEMQLLLSQYRNRHISALKLAYSTISRCE